MDILVHLLCGSGGDSLAISRQTSVRVHLIIAFAGSKLAPLRTDNLARLGVGYTRDTAKVAAIYLGDRARTGLRGHPRVDVCDMARTASFLKAARCVRNHVNSVLSSLVLVPSFEASGQIW